MASRSSARTRDVRWAVVAWLWMAVTLGGRSGGEEAPWPWQDQEPPAPAADFAGMWDLDPAEPLPDGEGSGLLFIEEPCVYMVEDIYERHDPSRRVVVRLPEYTRYDPQTQSIWVFLDGPFTTGAEVISRGTVGGADSELLATCPAHGQFTVTDMTLCGWTPGRC